MKKTFPLILLSLSLAACGGKSEDNAANDAASGKAPKPTFKVKYIDEQAIAGLDLGTAQEGETKEGKKQRTYPINGIEGGVINLIGKHPTDLEVISGQCMEKNEKGVSAGWSVNGVCHTAFAKMVDNIAQDGSKLTDYLISHAALQPYTEGKSGYAAVQNGRYILEIDSEGMFYFRRRHY